MKLRLHHVNVTAAGRQEVEDFYEKTLGLGRLPTPPLVEIEGYSETDENDIVHHPSSFFSAGDDQNLQLHVSSLDPYIHQRVGQSINPLIHGHIAFRCDDIEEVKLALKEADIPFSDYGEWGVKGWYQIFLNDPAGNVVEIQEVRQP
jgi:glyoxylase I family protein